MKNLEALVILVAISAVVTTPLDIHPLSDENIALINQKAKTWIAGRNFEIHEWESVKRMASGVLPDVPAPGSHSRSNLNPHNELDNAPESFDAREAWPKCDSIKQIGDQSECGSCWALAATEAMSDRICIHSNQTKQLYVSAENLMACCWGFDACGVGCYGGYIKEPWEYWRDTGIVTGGLYNSSQGCQDYSLPPCNHLSSSGDRPSCSDQMYETPACSKTCYDTSLNYNDSLTYGQEVFTFDNAEQMVLEIYKNGPIGVSFLVYEDFLNYKSGVYQRTSDEEVGRHAVKILGYGVENGTPYWLCANSWNADWGENGFFKILRGSNHVEIESNAASGLPLL